MQNQTHEPNNLDIKRARWVNKGKLIALVGMFGVTAGVTWLAKNERHVDDALQKAEKESKPQPLRLRAKLIQQVGAEAPERLLDNLAEKLDDIANAESGSMLPKQYCRAGCYRYACAVVPSLARVRRILEMTTKEQRPRLRAKLETMLKQSVHGFGRVYNEWVKEHNDGIDDPTKAPFDPPKRREYRTRCVNANVATYLLAECRCFESLPVMAKVFNEPSRRFPVSRLFVFYAMHLLASEQPRDGLTANALGALDQYLALTAANIPAPLEVSRAAWNAPIDEGDFRVKELGQKALIGKVRNVRLREYPVGDFAALEDIGAILVRDDHGLDRRVFRWYLKLSQFIELAYPRDARN